MTKQTSLQQRYIVGPLEAHHDRASFSCGVPALDSYLARQAGQDLRRNVATVFVAEERSDGAVHGFYTLSMASILLDQLPVEVAKRLPRYPSVPAVRLGRLAVHLVARNQGLGTHLLMDAMDRSLRTEIAWAGFLVEAKGEDAREFYRRFGFQPFSDEPNYLFLTRKTIAPLFAG